MSRDAAIRRFKLFQGVDPRAEGEFPLEIPASVFRAGDAIEVMYRSDKRDPATDRVPAKPIDYIHEHDHGVGYYRTDGGGTRVTVPAWLHREQHIVLIGKFLGAAYRDANGDEFDAKAGRGKTTLWTIPSGKALLVIDESKPRIVALVWGGKLGVFRRGIVH